MGYENYALIKKTTLTDIGNAIRGKTGGVELIDPASFATKINSIPSGSGGDYRGLSDSLYEHFGIDRTVYPAIVLRVATNAENKMNICFLTQNYRISNNTLYGVDNGLGNFNDYTIDLTGVDVYNSIEVVNAIISQKSTDNLVSAPEPLIYGVNGIWHSNILPFDSSVPQYLI